MSDEFVSIELLESTHEFPGPYMFKVIGKVDTGFVPRVVAAVREELEDLADPPYRTQQTASGRHVSITLEPIVQTGAQVISIYRRLQETEGLVMIW